MTYTQESYNDDYRLFCAVSRICTSVGISTTFEKDVYPVVSRILPHEHFSLFLVSLSLVPILCVMNVNFLIRFVPQMSPLKSGESLYLSDHKSVDCKVSHPKYFAKTLRKNSRHVVVMAWANASPAFDWRHAW